MSRSLRCAHHHQKHILRRLYSSHHNAPDLDVKHQLRALLRESAQPVTVVTALLPSSSSTEREDIAKRYHGATLSSFTSIAMDPYPLISFSLRVPSRMGKGLSSAFSSSGSVSSLGLEGKGKGKGKEKAYDEENTEEGTEEEETHLVINLLSSTQTDLAVVFSRPDLYPHPFTTPIPTPIPSSPSSSLPQGHERQEGQKLKVEYALNRSGIPILSNSLGALSCRLVCSPVDLSFYSSNLKSGVAGAYIHQCRHQSCTLLVLFVFTTRQTRTYSENRYCITGGRIRVVDRLESRRALYPKRIRPCGLGHSNEGL